MLCKHEVVGSRPSGSTSFEAGLSRLAAITDFGDEPHKILSSADMRVMRLTLCMKGLPGFSRAFRADLVEDYRLTFLKGKSRRGWFEARSEKCEAVFG